MAAIYINPGKMAEMNEYLAPSNEYDVVYAQT